MTYRKQNFKYLIALITSLTIAALFLLPQRGSCQLHPVKSDSISLVSDTVSAASDSAKGEAIKDSVKKNMHSPRKAGIYSAVVPGLGQIYNHKYWKLPIIYTGLGVAAGLIYYNFTIYNNLRKAYILRVNGSTDSLNTFSVWSITGTLHINLALFQNSDILSLEESYRRDFDLSVIFAVAMYGLNVIDAIVDAHLFNFDVSNNLSFNVQPSYGPVAGFGNYTPALNVTMRF